VIVSAPYCLFTGSPICANPKVVSKTVFPDPARGQPAAGVHVIGLGPATNNVQPASGATNFTGNGGATSGVTSSLTVELTQCDAEYLTWFLNNTSVRYTLESFHDYTPAPIAADATCQTIIKAGGVSNTIVDTRYHFTSL
jgi:hypothetical protein